MSAPESVGRVAIHVRSALPGRPAVVSLVDGDRRSEKHTQGLR